MRLFENYQGNPHQELMDESSSIYDLINIQGLYASSLLELSYNLTNSFIYSIEYEIYGNNLQIIL